MRRRLIIGIVTLVGLVTLVVVVTLDRNGTTRATGAAAAMEPVTITSGAIDVKIEPRMLDDQQAVFVVTLDTHSGELAMDLTSAELQVGGALWPVAGWDGDGPTGHHRAGELRFRAAGPAAGAVRLALPGFPDVVQATWTLGG